MNLKFPCFLHFWVFIFSETKDRVFLFSLEIFKWLQLISLAGGCRADWSVHRVENMGDNERGQRACWNPKGIRCLREYGSGRRHWIVNPFSFLYCLIFFSFFVRFGEFCVLKFFNRIDLLLSSNLLIHIVVLSFVRVKNIVINLLSMRK